MDHRQTFQQSGKQDSIKHLLNILNGIFRKCKMAFFGNVKWHFLVVYVKILILISHGWWVIELKCNK